MRKVFTSESLSSEMFEDLNKLLTTVEGRTIFTSLIFQSSFTSINHQILSDESFRDLRKLISVSLAYTVDEPSEFLPTRLIAKSTLYYYK
jgi:hypothetical protein